MSISGGGDAIGKRASNKSVPYTSPPATPQTILLSYSLRRIEGAGHAKQKNGNP